MTTTKTTATAVALRWAALSTVAGAGEAAVRTLTKLDQVMPPRQRAELRALQYATDTVALVGLASWCSRRGAGRCM